MARWCAATCVAYSIADRVFVFIVRSDHLFELNYAITLFNHNELDNSKAHFKEFKTLWNDLEDEVKNADPDVVEQMMELEKSLLGQ